MAEKKKEKKKEKSRRQRYTSIICHNRDEELTRPAATAEWWSRTSSAGKTGRKIFAGRDLQAGGTWCGVNDEGQVAALTNFRVKLGGSAGRKGEAEAIWPIFLLQFFFVLHLFNHGFQQADGKLGTLNVAIAAMGILSPVLMWLKHFVLNKSSGSEPKGKARPSRGHLACHFLEHDVTGLPRDYAQDLVASDELLEYDGFSLVVGDLGKGEFSFVYKYSDSEVGCCTLEPGIHAISNGRRGSKWFKVERGKILLEQVLDADVGADDSDDDVVRDILQQVMQDGKKMPADETPPDTGYGDDLERKLSSIRVFNTRAHTIILGRSDGMTIFYESARQEDGTWKVTRKVLQT